MKMHSNLIHNADIIRTALDSAKENGTVDSAVYFDVLDYANSRRYNHAWNFHLFYNGVKVPGVKRSNTYNHDAKAATWHEYGWLFVQLFEFDPDAKIGPYDGVDDFHEKTRYVFA